MRSRLHADIRDAFLERDRLGWPQQRIADDLGISPHTVGMWSQDAGPRLPEMATPGRLILPPGVRADLGSGRYRESLAGHLVQVAQHLACLVRDESPEAVRLYLAGLDPTAREMLPIILAAMVPVDATPEQLLSWVTWDRPDAPDASGPATEVEKPPAPPRVNAPPPLDENGQWPDCGSYAAARRHKNHGSAMCPPCRKEYRKRDAAYRRNARVAKGAKKPTQQARNGRQNPRKPAQAAA